MADGTSRDEMQAKNARLSSFRNAGVRAWALVMLLGLVVGLLFFARPTSSTVEKRELTPPPTANAARFLDGSFFTDLSLWYADTYPLREPLVAVNQAMQRAYGVQPKVKFVGGNVDADELPSSSAQESSSAETRDWDAVEAPEIEQIQEQMQQQLMAGLYVKDGAAYNVYYFVEEGATAYIEAINRLAGQLEGQAQVYSLLVPNGSAILLSESELESLGGSSQEQAIAYFYGRFDEAVRCVDVMGALRAHADDYIYFRTDHHWTQLGATYAYQAFCDLRGFQAQDNQKWERMVFDDFLGTFYAETSDSTLVADSVTALIPPQTNDIVFTDSDGSLIDSHVINDVSGWGQGTGYYCYGIGDYQLTHVENPKKTDGSSCLLLKDSYGNCLAPQLIGHYQDLWVIDYRYSDTDIVQFVREHGIQDVVVENNVSIATAEQVAYSLLDQVKRSSEESTEGAS